MKSFVVVLMLLLLVGIGLGQTTPPSTPPTPLFSCATDAVGVRQNAATNPGTDINCAYNITTGIAIETHNILVPATNAQDYFGGLSWTPNLSKLLAKTTLPKNTFQPFVHGAFGVARNVPTGAPTTQGYGGIAGGGVRYDPNGSGKFTITLVRVDYYNHSGAGPSPNGLLFGAGLQYVFGQR